VEIIKTHTDIHTSVCTGPFNPLHITLDLLESSALSGLVTVSRRVGLSNFVVAVVVFGG
jgi:hypothetical protein